MAVPVAARLLPVQIDYTKARCTFPLLSLYAFLSFPLSLCSSCAAQVSAALAVAVVVVILSIQMKCTSISAFGCAFCLSYVSVSFSFFPFILLPFLFFQRKLIVL